jgi:hypothetical protein
MYPSMASLIHIRWNPLLLPYFSFLPALEIGPTAKLSNIAKHTQPGTMVLESHGGFRDGHSPGYRGQGTYAKTACRVFDFTPSLLPPAQYQRSLVGIGMCRGSSEG